MLDVITIGTATRDVFLTSSLFKVLKDKAHLKRIGFKTGEAECFALGSKLEIERPAVTIGGGAANAAVTFARQNFRTAAIIKVGDDDLGEGIINDLKKEKIVPLATKDKDSGTAYSTILLTPGGERTILVYRGASGNFKKREVPFGKLRAKAAYIAPGNTDFSLMQQIVMQLKKNKVLIAMNPSKKYLDMGSKLQMLLRSVNVVILNREEASHLTGVDYGKERLIFKKLDELVDGVAVMTDAAKGALVSDGQYVYKAGIFKEKKLVDRTGAGDAFGSGFVAGYLQKQDIHYALRVASANATSVVEVIGAQDGILRKKDLNNKRWKYLDLDVEPL